MKLAILAFLSLDARSGVIPRPEMRPYNEVLTDFKSRVAKNELPADIVDAGMNQMEIWTPRGGRVKHHRFNLDLVARGEPIAPVEYSESDPELEAALARVEELEAILAATGDPSPEEPGTNPDATSIPDEIQTELVPGLSSSEPPAETPAATEDSTSGPRPAAARPSPSGGGKKSGGKKS